jgi:putative CocE/NonD family hydrolase
MKSLGACLAVLVLAVSCVEADPVRAADADALERTCTETLVPLPDGVRLHAWVRHDAPIRRRPVLVEFDPYTLPDNGCPQTFPSGEPDEALAPQVSDRFTLLHVNLRGTGPSEGRTDLFGPATQRDLPEAIAWARRQPWSNGDIVLMGWSATGISVHHGLDAPGVKAAVVYTSCADVFRCIRPGGVYNAAGDVAATFMRLSYASGTEARARLGLVTNPMPSEQVAALEEGFRQVRTRTPYDGFWRERSALAKVARAEVPVLYTVDPSDVVSPFDGYLATPDRRLVLGLGHTSSGAASAPGSRHGELVRAVVDRFVRRHGLGEHIEQDAPVVVVTNTGSSATWQAGETFVRGERSWPLPSTRWTRLWFGDGVSGTASSSNDGTLRTRSGDTGSDTAPLVGGPDHYGDFRIVNYRAGGVATDLRHDERVALTYTSDPFRQDLEVTGPITVRLVASATTPELDWVVRLTDVWPDGRSEWITDGALRASMRKVDHERSLRNRRGEIVRPYLTLDAPEPVPTGAPVEYLFELFPTSNVFRAGHRLRIDVFPVSASGTDPGTLGSVGEVVVHRGPGGSSVLLPVIPARCQRGQPMVPEMAPLRCAKTYAQALGAGSGARRR